MSSRDGNAEIYVMTPTAASRSRVTTFQLDDWGPMWSPDGRRSRSSATASSSTGLPDTPDGTELRRLTADPTRPARPDVASATNPTRPTPPSPPTAPVAYLRPQRPRARPCAHRAAGGALTDLTDGAGQRPQPRWSPDGAHLVFVSSRDGGRLELYGMTRTGARLTRLTRAKDDDWSPRWAPR